MRERIANLLPWTLLLLFALGSWWVQQQVARPEESVLAYSPWQPRKPCYAPGEPVFFDVDRVASLRGRQSVHLIVQTAWQRRDDGLTYPLPPLVHVVTIEGPSRRLLMRPLPPVMEPGRYFLTGWAETVSQRLAPALATIESRDIEVLPPPAAAPPAP